ncbi:PREDICTED: UDP-glycosyltransferase 83A1-like [Camelina sativa]|uniref:UDP-glycosyltransferase 83A1-like n=1 Tax=Camelina sativa TaxID=90675 RepID=A0ABM0XFY5_CAMSA|nr:PREDICTED: UDP-glycosyltransferase 83A1-like [Camelina sativa]
MVRPHVVVIPYPAQGHVLPLMSFSRYLAKQGIQITFVNTEFNHNRIISSLPKSSPDDYVGNGINLVSIPDGLEDSPEERNIPGKLSESVLHFMPTKVEELIGRMIADSSGGTGTIISCVVADQSLGWAIEVAVKFGIRRAAFCPAAAASMVLGFSIKKLIDDGLIDSDGTPSVNKTIQLSPGMPMMETDKFVWFCLKNKESQRNIFQLMLQNNESVESTDWLLCNSVYELETAAFGLCPQILPVGPIGWVHSLEEDSISTSLGSFLPQDRDCLEWLDRQIPGSVIYVAFGSFGVISNAQLEELAIGLELTKRPVLWVTGSGYQPPIKVGSDQVKVVRWAPQREVLSCGAIGCFVSHCGWNSTLEGAQNGIPFLCIPYFADQFINKAYICDVWKIGLGFERDEQGVVPRLEVKKNIDEIMRDGGVYKQRAMKVKEIMMRGVAKDGVSYENLHKFVSWIKSQVN